MLTDLDPCPRDRRRKRRRTQPRRFLLSSFLLLVWILHPDTTATRTHAFTSSTSLLSRPWSSRPYSTSLHLADPSSLLQHLPFEDVARQLADALDIGAGLSQSVGKIPEQQTMIVLESIGYDLLIFLAASVVVTLISASLRITPILGYLLAGAVLGPHALDWFANTKADVEFGDFGILFLLFSEGLDVSSQRLQKLSNYLPLGLAQISLTTGVITLLLLTGVPQMLGQILPLDAALLPVRNPIEAVVLGLAGALSTSAFIFPVLKERKWEEEESGQAATSILLLQDLMVAPLLVLLPYLVGQSETDYGAIAFLTLKATVGFGSVIYAGKFLLQRLFGLVAQTRSTETFVAACLLTSVGMGVIAKFLGLTDTAGAFFAGVLLANTNYRAQIQADILPFKGILLGIFFMDAGSNFDTDLVLRELPTVLTGVVALMLIKAVTLGLATRVPRWMEPNRLAAADGVRIALLLSGGGEFAFVVLALAEKLKLIPQSLGGVLTAIILITMGLTPLVGQLAAIVSEPLLSFKEEGAAEKQEESASVAHNAVVVSGYGEIGQAVLQTLGSLPSESQDDSKPARIVAFDTEPTLARKVLRPGNGTAVLFGNGANSEMIRSCGVHEPSCIFITYESHNRVLSATSRLRGAFSNTPIFARAATRYEAQMLKVAGATDVVVESDELPKSAAALLRSVRSDSADASRLEPNLAVGFDDIRVSAAAAAGVSLGEVDKLFNVYQSMNQGGSGCVSVEEVEAVLGRSTNWIASDDEIRRLDEWIKSALMDFETVTFMDLCRLYGRAPSFVRQAFGISQENLAGPEG